MLRKIAAAAKILRLYAMLACHTQISTTRVQLRTLMKFLWLLENPNAFLANDRKFCTLWKYYFHITYLQEVSNLKHGAGCYV